MKLKFWGTRGSLPTPGQETVKYGGDTTCLEVISEQGDEYIFDGGSGIAKLGRDLLKRGFAYGKGGRAKIFLTHEHWDHIQGLPFFVPAYIPTNNITVLGEAKAKKRLKDILSGQMDDPYFPVPMAVQGGLTEFRDLVPGASVENGITVTYWNGNHPNTSLVYSVAELGNKVVFATDYEHDGQMSGQQFGQADTQLINFSRGADILIYDGQYTPSQYIPIREEELAAKLQQAENNLRQQGKSLATASYEDKRALYLRDFKQSKIGWGHSTCKAGIDVALEAGVKHLLLTHHDPANNDSAIDAILGEAQAYLKQRGAENKLQVSMAYDGLEMRLN